MQKTPPYGRQHLLVAFAVAVSLLLVAAVLGLELGGGAAPLALADPGPLVRWGLPLVRGITDFAMAASIGALTMASFATAQGTWQLRRLLTLAGSAATIWTLAGIVSAIFTYLSVTGTQFSPSDSFGQGVWFFFTNIALGQSLGLNLIAAALIAVLALSITRLVPTILVTVLGFAALVPLAVSGHAAGTQGHSMAVNAIGLHLVAVSVWVGGLVSVFALRSKDEVSNLQVLKKYSSLALFAYLVIMVSGIASAAVRITSLAQLSTGYGQIVLIKVGILVAGGVLGALYRLRLIKRPSVTGLFWRLLTAELGFMGLAMGLAAALSHTAPPAQSVDLSNPTPAQILTGEKLPPELTSVRWFTEWKIDLVWLILAALGIVLYLAGVYRMRKRGDKWSVPRTISWVSGMLLLAWITCGPMNVYEQYLFSVHMISHMMLTMGVPLLLVPGAPVTLISRAVKKRSDGSRGVREWVLWAVNTPFARLVSNPLFAAINFASSLIIFYYTPLFSWATREHLGHEWMIVHFIITGYLFVQALVGIDPGPKPVNFPVRLIILLGTLTFHALFGLSLMMGNGLLLADWYGAMGRTWGQPPLMDQQTGGAIAWGIGEFPAAFLTLMVCVQWFNDDSREAKRKDRASDRSGGADLEAYNQMLATVAAKRAAAQVARDAEFERAEEARKPTETMYNTDGAEN
jgi:cytochrome c oxidase assembly factor CtaG/putative copper export protein